MKLGALFDVKMQGRKLNLFCNFIVIEHICLQNASNNKLKASGDDKALLIITVQQSQYKFLKLVSINHLDIYNVILSGSCRAAQNKTAQVYFP
jgi:hypothetical protein